MDAPLMARNAHLMAVESAAMITPYSIQESLESWWARLDRGGGMCPARRRAKKSFFCPVSNPPFRAIAQIPEYRQISILAYCTCFATVLFKNEYQFWRTRKINFGGAVWEPPLLGLCRIYIRCCFAVCAQTIGWRLKEKVDPPVSTRKKERSNSSMV